MDPAGMAEVRDLIRSLGGDNRTVILSSHLLHEVEQVCDSVAILSRGRLIAQGDVAELLQERGQAQVRLRTTDDAKAREIMSALAWVDSVSADNGYLVAGVAPERSWEITAALSRNQIYVAEMSPAQMSLEQYFLDVTEEAAPRSEAA